MEGSAHGSMSVACIQVAVGQQPEVVRLSPMPSLHQGHYAGALTCAPLQLHQACMHTSTIHPYTNQEDDITVVILLYVQFQVSSCTSYCSEQYVISMNHTSVAFVRC